MPHTEGHATPIGRSILEMVEEQLNLVEVEYAAEENHSIRHAYLSGKLDGLALAISIFLNPYDPRPDKVLASLGEKLPQVSQKIKEPAVVPVVEVDTEWVL